MSHSLLALAQAAAQAQTPTSIFLQAGIPGAVAVVLAGVVLALWRDNRAIQRTANEALDRHQATLAALQQKRVEDLAALQQRRVEDAQAVAAQHLRLTEQCTAALTTATATMEAQREALTELRSAIHAWSDSRPSRR